MRDLYVHRCNEYLFMIKKTEGENKCLSYKFNGFYILIQNWNYRKYDTYRFIKDSSTRFYSRRFGDKTVYIFRPLGTLPDFKFEIFKNICLDDDVFLGEISAKTFDNFYTGKYELKNVIVKSKYMANIYYDDHSFYL